MPKENLMNSDHKATNKAYRDNYDRIFRQDPYYKKLMEGSDTIIQGMGGSDVSKNQKD